MFYSNLLRIIRALEWGPKLLNGRGGAESAPPPVNSATKKAKIITVLWKLVWLKISIVRNFGDPRLISSRSNKFEMKKILNFVEKCIPPAF